MVLKPEIIDCFRLHQGKIFKDAQSSRKFEHHLWNQMLNGDRFLFDWRRGVQRIKIPDTPPFDFPMAKYLLSLEKEKSLKKILGPDVKIVTQRNVLTDLMYTLLKGEKANYTIKLYFERFGDIIFVKELQENRSFQHTAEDRFLEKRKEFFNGDDLPGCIGSTPLREFDFPDVGNAYSILSLKRGNSRILYSCAIKNFSPDGEPMDSILSRNSLIPSESKERSMLLKAATDGYKHHMFFKFLNGRAQMEFRDTESALGEYPCFYEALEKALDILLDPRILKFLANRRGCTAHCEFEPELRLKPEDFPPDYKSFLSKEFFMRFFDDED